MHPKHCTNTEGTLQFVSHSGHLLLEQSVIGSLHQLSTPITLNSPNFQLSSSLPPISPRKPRMAEFRNPSGFLGFPGVFSGILGSGGTLHCLASRRFSTHDNTSGNGTKPNDSPSKGN